MRGETRSTTALRSRTVGAIFESCSSTEPLIAASQQRRNSAFHSFCSMQLVHSCRPITQRARGAPA